jgi:hypothetical protein
MKDWGDNQKNQLSSALIMICCLFSVSFFLISCIFPEPDSEALTARRSGFASNPPCGGCHEYPPPDLNHYYHLSTVFNSTVYSEPVICYDCHAKSIQADTQFVLDTIFQGLFGEELSSLDYPDDERIRL